MKVNSAPTLRRSLRAHGLGEVLRPHIDEDREMALFLVREYWQNVGRKKDFRRVNGEYEEIFEACWTEISSSASF